VAEIVGWVDPDDVAEEWADAPDDPDTLVNYLTAAYEQCVEYLPPVDLKPYPEPIPARYRQAQVKQARALYRADLVGSGDQTAPDGYGVTVYPMDWTVKNLLRPRKVGRPG